MSTHLEHVATRVASMHQRHTGGYCDEQCLGGFYANEHEVHVALQDLPAVRAGTMRDWMVNRHDQRLHTVQVTKADGAAWAPIDRVIDAQSRKGGVYLSESFREYAGFRVIGSREDALLVESDTSVILYVVRGAR